MTNMNKIFKTLLLGAALSVGAMSASADLIDIDVEGVASWDGEGDPDNTVLLLDLGNGGPVTIDGFGWDLAIETTGASWLSEATIGIGGIGQENLLTLNAGVGDGFPGTGNYSSDGIIDFSDNGLADIVLADGILRIEFFESFDDVNGEIDAFYSGFVTASGTGFTTTVPEPGMLALLGFGLVGMGLARRRKAA